MWWSSCFSAVTEVEKKKKKMVSPQDQGERKGKADNRRLKLFGEAKKESKVAAAAEGVQPDWVRVKARRGQATDSHSLAERARREKISARMKLLQSIVPGCDQITGKAQVLDEIIKYVQLLQNQVECLAAKVAFVDVMLYDCELNPSTIPGASNERLWFLEPPLRSVQEPSSIQYRSLADAALGNSASPLLREDQKPSFSPQVQDGGDLLLDMNNQYFEDIVNEPAGLDTDPAPSNF